jgi:hypothetical protein
MKKLRSYKIMKMQMFALSEKVKPDTENTRGLGLAAVKRTTIQVTRQPLYHELNEIRYELLRQPYIYIYILYIHIS